MKAKIKDSLLVLIFVITLSSAFSHCDIRNRVAPDGSMQFFIEPANFYYTKSKSLSGGIVTDKESYFLEPLPVFSPEKPSGNKLNQNNSIL